MSMPIVDYQTIANAQSVELTQLREQNRVLASHLNNLVEWALEVTKDWTVDDDSTLANDLRMIWQAQAAITAPSQPAKPAGKMHACDIPGCVSCGNPEDATSQEGQG